MEFDGFELEYVYPHMTAKLKQLKDFLQGKGLGYEKDCEFSLLIKSGGELAGTGSVSGRVLKCIAVDERYEGLGLAVKIVSELISYAARQGRNHLFIFTKPESGSKFSELGFYEIARSGNDAVLLENRRDGVRSYLESLGYKPQGDKPSGCIVANCNPFTNGHLSLIEYAAKQCEVLHVFVLMENRSEFPPEDRLRLVQEGVIHLKNVVVHGARDYLISAATFPTYFLKKASDIARIHARLDLDIFCVHIARFFNIQKRFVGEEPFCELTSVYNEEMSKKLPLHGIELCIVPRVTAPNGDIISASSVRAFLANGEMERIKSMVPNSTYKYLLKHIKDGR